MPTKETKKEPGIVQRKGRSGWYVRLIVHGRHKWYRCATKTEAKALHARLKSQIWEGTYFPDKFTQKNLMTVKAWLEQCWQGSTNRTRTQERQRGMYWATLLGHRLLRDLNLNELRKIQARMLESGKWKPATINRYFSALRRPLSLAVQEGLISRHPMKGLKFLPEPVKDRFFTDEELGRMRAIMSDQEWDRVAFALGTCLRASEQFRLRWDQVNLEGSVLTIPLPKGNKTRRVPLSQEMKAILRRQFSESPWVFPDPSNPLAPLGRHAPSKAFSKALNTLAIPHASWHTLRHTGASRLLRAGIDIVTVSKILGHSTIHTTMRYCHLVKDQLHEAVNRVSLEGIQHYPTGRKDEFKVIQK